MAQGTQQLKTTIYHHQQFVQQQRKRENDWKLEPENQLRKKKKQDHDFHSPDLEHFTSTCKVLLLRLILALLLTCREF